MNQGLPAGSPLDQPVGRPVPGREDDDAPHTGNWMTPHEAERLANLWCAGQPLDDLPQWRTVMHVLMRELHSARDALAAMLPDIKTPSKELCGKCGHKEACAAMGCKTPNVEAKGPSRLAGEGPA